MEDSSNIRLVVPRENVTNGVIHTLALDSAGMREKAPIGNIEIEFIDEIGQDDGGIRRSWFVAASNAFVQSDFLLELQDNASHLSGASIHANHRRPGGRRWTPAAALVCEQLQADWEAQFR